jgi:hypothetical protein
VAWGRRLPLCSPVGDMLFLRPKSGDMHRAILLVANGASAQSQPRDKLPLLAVASECGEGSSPQLNAH